MFFSMMSVLLLFIFICVVAFIWVIVNNQPYKRPRAKRR
jgi:hypothetical protein